MRYAELLRKPQWQRRRLEIMARDGFACRVCGESEEMLQVHHLAYRAGALPWDYAASELVALCESCHDTHHHFEDVLALDLSREYATYIVAGNKEGRHAAFELASACLSRLRRASGFVFLPQGEDAASYARRMGRESLSALVGSRIPFTRYLLDEAACCFDRLSEQGRHDFTSVSAVIAKRLPESDVRTEFLAYAAGCAAISEETLL